MVGSGNHYTHHTIISEISKRKYDLIIPMWNNYLWMDFRNAFHERHEEPLHNLNPHKPLVNTNWMFDKTELIDPEYQTKKNLLYQLHHQFYDKSLKLESTLINVISTQGVLEANHIPYIHCFYRKFKQLNRFENLYKLINQENVYPINLYNLALENDWWDGDHPMVNAHRAYAADLAEYISTKNLAKS